MRNLITILLVSVTLCFAQQPAPQNPPPVDSQSTIRSTSQEVLLDVVVRDKKGRQVKDLTAKDLVITDDGEHQTIRSFRFINGIDGPAEAGAAATVPEGKPSGGMDPLRQIRIITLVFGRLGDDGRNNARTAVNDLLKNETGPNLFFAVFSIDQRLSVLQQYTTNKELVRKAVLKVTSSASSLYKSESDQIEQEVRTLATMDAASASVTTPGAGVSASSGSFASVALAQLTLNMMQFSQSLDRTLQGRSDLFSLEALVNQQYRLPGRKTIMYFCEGLTIPPDYTDEFQGLISTANRYNVSVYGIDSRGLTTNGQNGVGGDLLKQATSGSMSQIGQNTGAVTYQQATALDRASESIQANSQNSLAEISNKTGGFMIANTNDLRNQLRQVTEDIDTHYEISYAPDIRNFDGHFRKITVNVSRPEIRIQSRAGYYALPFMKGQSLLSYEVPMLNALSAAALPHDISFRALGLHFKSPAGDPEGVIVFDVPLDGIEFTKDDAKKMYQTHFSVLALVKDAQGTVVRKLSQDIPRQGPLDKIDAFKLGHFIYSQYAPLPAGRYTLETAVTDRNSGKVSAKKSVILIPSEEGLGISSVVRVRNVTQRDPSTPASPDDPFEVATGKISPGLDEVAKGGPGNVLSFFFTVYAPAGTKLAPDLSMEFLKDGQLIGRGAPPLPAPDSHGLIPYIASTPLDSFKPGQYELRITVTQNGKAATERAAFTIE